MPETPIPDYTIIIGSNIHVTEPYTFAFGGFNGTPIYSTRISEAEHAMLICLCERAVKESTVSEDNQPELPL